MRFFPSLPYSKYSVYQKATKETQNYIRPRIPGIQQHEFRGIHLHILYGKKTKQFFSKQLSVAIKTFFLVVETFLNHLLLLSALASTSRKMVTPGNFLSLQSFQRLHRGQHPSALALWGSLLPTSACIFYISIPCVLPAVGLHPHEKGQSLAYPFLLPH